MSYGKLVLYSIIPVGTILIGFAVAQIFCIALGILAEVAVVAAFVGMRRKQRRENAPPGTERIEPVHRSA